jgi:hypothetical protein
MPIRSSRALQLKDEIVGGVRYVLVLVLLGAVGLILLGYHVPRSKGVPAR